MAGNGLEHHLIHQSVSTIFPTFREISTSRIIWSLVTGLSEDKNEQIKRLLRINYGCN